MALVIPSEPIGSSSVRAYAHLLKALGVDKTATTAPSLPAAEPIQAGPLDSAVVQLESMAQSC
jgi:hypothetical protein